MNKICTSPEQSKKLIELGIDVNTADMYWWPTSLRYYIEAIDDGDFNEEEGHILAWSLSALLGLMPKFTLEKENEEYKCCYNYNIIYRDEPIDAAFEMIVWLKENNKL